MGKYSRTWSILLVVFIFLVGNILQAASKGYEMLVIARLIGGEGICMLSTVALCVSQIGPYVFYVRLAVDRIRRTRKYNL